jgi:hypothetical protein
MRKIPSCLCLIAIASATRLLLADTIVLTNGEKLEGKITDETPAQVTIQSRSGGVTDERSVLRSEIKSLEKQAPDEAEFQPLKNMKPGPNWLRPEDYDAAIALLKNFIQRYPLSAHADEAKQMLDVFETERTRVVGGEVKFHAKWLSAAEAARQKDDIIAEAYLDSMKDLAARGNLVGALNTFDALEKKYPGARSYPDAVDLASRVIFTLEPEVERRLLTVKNDYEKLQQEWKTYTAQQKADVEVALKREYDQLDASLAASEAAKIKWAPFQARSKKALEKLKATIQVEKPRLAAIPVSKMRDSIERTRMAANELAARDVNGADGDLKLALTDWPQNSDALLLQKDITARKAEVAKATPTPKPGGANGATATPKPTPAKPAATPTPKPWWKFFGAAQRIVPGSV